MRSRIDVALALAYRQTTLLFKNPSLFLPPMLFPLMNFLAFAGGLSRLRHIPGFEFKSGYTAFQFVFVLLQSAAFGGVFAGFGIARDFERGFAKRLLVSAPQRGGIILGYALASLVRWLMIAFVLTIVALLAHMQVGGDGVDLFGLFVLAVIFNQVGLLWAAGVAMRVRSSQAGRSCRRRSSSALPRTRLRPAQPAQRLDPRRRQPQSAHVPHRGRPRLHRRRPDPGRRGVLVAGALLVVFAVWARTGLARAERAG